jgi:hypothetical protein
MLVALLSARGSPGVTTAALAMTLRWPRPVVLAEADPAGGTIMAGYLAGKLPADRGIGELAVAALRGDDLGSVWWGQLVDLQPQPQAQARRRLLLPGMADPVQAGAVGPTWDRLADWFTGLALSGFDVIADCGRLVAPHAPWPLLARADVVLLVLPASLPGIVAATPAVRALRGGLGEHRAGTLGLALCGRGDQSARTVAVELATPVLVEFPHDERAARVLTRGGTIRGSEALIRAASGAYQRLAGHLARQLPAAPAIGVAGRLAQARDGGAMS